MCALRNSSAGTIILPASVYERQISRELNSVLFK